MNGRSLKRLLWFSASAAFVVLVGCSGALTQVRHDEPPSMSRIGALKLLHEVLKTDEKLRSGRAVCNFTVSSQYIQQVCPSGFSRRINYRDYDSVAVSSHCTTDDGKQISDCYRIELQSSRGKSPGNLVLLRPGIENERVITTAKALHTLAVSPPIDPSASAFEPEAKRYRQAGIPTELPEDVRRYRVQAESAVREKRFFYAAEAYDKALRVAPWWPQGHFNLALLYAELDLYAEAQTEMNKYLLLAPDAPNTRAAQDKVYEWEAKAGSVR